MCRVGGIFSAGDAAIAAVEDGILGPASSGRDTVGVPDKKIGSQKSVAQQLIANRRKDGGFGEGIVLVSLSPFLTIVERIDDHDDVELDPFHDHGRE